MSEMKPTRGEWRVESYRYYASQSARAEYPIHAPKRGLIVKAFREIDARLIAEAGTVFHECGLSPRQLVEMNAELVEALVAAQQMINGMKAEAETAAQGDEQMMLEACETISNEGLQADMDIRAALTKASASSISKGVE